MEPELQTEISDSANRAIEKLRSGLVVNEMIGYYLTSDEIIKRWRDIIESNFLDKYYGRIKELNNKEDYLYLLKSIINETREKMIRIKRGKHN